MGRRCIEDDTAQWLPSLRGAEHDDMSVIAKSLGALSVMGASINSEAMYPSASKVVLPTYAFEKVRCWFKQTGAASDDVDCNGPPST